MNHPPVSRHGRANNGLRPWLVAVKSIGVVLAIGGLAALSAMRLFGPVPRTPDEWRLHIAIMRAIFFPCVLAGLLVTVIAGLLLLGPRWRTFAALRWFRIKALALVVALPALHLWGRGHVLALYDAVDGGRLDDAAAHWSGAGAAFAVAFVVLLALATLARTKPRLGQ